MLCSLNGDVGTWNYEYGLFYGIGIGTSLPSRIMGTGWRAFPNRGLQAAKHHGIVLDVALELGFRGRGPHIKTGVVSNPLSPH